MGLDMYAYAVPEEWAIDDETIAKPGEAGRSEDSVLNDFFYWRKHHDLHGWMQELYASRGGTESFNCIPIRLYPEDLDALAADIRAGVLPETTGFFFGNNPPDEDSMVEDLKFVEEARQYIADGFAVYYDSWW